MMIIFNLILIVILIIAIIGLVVFKINESYREKKELKGLDDRIANEHIKLKALEEKLASDIKSLEEQYGIISDKLFVGIGWLDERNICGYIFVFDESKLVLVCGRLISYSDITSVDILREEDGIIQGESKSITKTSTGSMVGRAIVGGVLLGGVGALAGAATAKKETTTYSSDPQIRYSFKVRISIENTLKEIQAEKPPYCVYFDNSDIAILSGNKSDIAIVCGHNNDKANKIMVIFSKIIEQNRGR